MPVGPNNIMQVRHEIMKWTYAEIDSKLLDPQQSTRFLQGDPDDYYYKFVLAARFNDHEKAEITKSYEDAGWQKVVVATAHNNLSTVTLYSKAESRFLRYARQSFC